MSEYQYVCFRAIDGPVSKSDLAFMAEQSSRAKITAWSFENEYHFGDFSGDADEMLRRGYDFHFHYADFGIRKLMIRLPNGLPDLKSADPYFELEGLSFDEDKDGPGGTLKIECDYEPGTLDNVDDVGSLIERLLPLRAELIQGDLRPLYLAHLVMANTGYGDEEEEGPVPAGLDRPTDAQQALMEFYGLSATLVAVAAEASPPMRSPAGSDPDYAGWLARQPESSKNRWLLQLLEDPASPVRRELIAAFQKEGKASLWPTAKAGRKISDMLARVDALDREAEQNETARAARERAQRLADFAKHPEKVFQQASKLVSQRSSEAYSQAAELLAELREALGDQDESALAQRYAHDLKNQNLSRKGVVTALRSKGFLQK